MELSGTYHSVNVVDLSHCLVADGPHGRCIDFTDADLVPIVNYVGVEAVREHQYEAVVSLELVVCAMVVCARWAYVRAVKYFRGCI